MEPQIIQCAEGTAVVLKRVRVTARSRPWMWKWMLVLFNILPEFIIID